MSCACSPCATWYGCFITVTFLLHLFSLKQINHCISQAADFFIRQQFNSWKPFRFLHICTPLTLPSLHKGFHVSIFLSEFFCYFACLVHSSVALVSFSAYLKNHDHSVQILGGGKTLGGRVLLEKWRCCVTVVAVTCEKQQQDRSRTPGEPPQGMTVAQTIATGPAETPQAPLEAPAAEQLLRGAGMWAPCSLPPRGCSPGRLNGRVWPRHSSWDDHKLHKHSSKSLFYIFYFFFP